MEEKIKENLISSFDEMAPYDFDEIMKHKLVRVETESELLGWEQESLEDPIEASTTVSRAKTIRRVLRYVAALAAIMILAFSVYIFDQFRITDELCLDVNPSVCMSFNRAGNVVKVEGINEDGKIVVDSVRKSLNGVKDPVNAVRLLVEEIDREGYFKNDSTDIMISVGFSKKEKKEILDSVVKYLEEFTDKNELQKTFIIQVYQKSKELDEKSSASAISPGKYVFLSRIAEKTGIEMDEIKDKTVGEINKYMKSYKDLYESDDFTIIEEIPDKSIEINEKEDSASEDKNDNKEVKNKDRDKDNDNNKNKNKNKNKDSSYNDGKNKDSSASSGKNKGKSDNSKVSESKKSSDNKSASADKKNKSDKASDSKNKNTEDNKTDKVKSKDKKSKDNKSSEKDNKEKKEKKNKTSGN